MRHGANTTLNPSDKLNAAPPAAGSRYHHWKLQVLPGTAFEARGVPIRPGGFDFGLWRLEMDSAKTRRVSGSVVLRTGKFFDGDQQGGLVLLRYQPSAFFSGSLDYDINEINLPDGDFTTRIAHLRANFSFNPELSWNNFLQWDDGTHSYGIFSKLRWIPAPGKELLLVLNETLDDDQYRSLSNDIAFKVVYTMRF